MRVAALWIYPVKSLRGIELQSSRVEARGLQFDRRWMIVDRDGVFRSQRDFPVMATISTAIEANRLRLSCAGLGEVCVPIDFKGEPTEVRVWTADCQANLVSPEADEWLSKAIGAPSRLAAMPDSSRRSCNRLYARPGDIVGFADACPALFAGLASLADLNSKLAIDVPIDRFRANVIVEGSSPFAEDDWAEVLIGSIPFHYLKPCGRCIITTTDQKTGARGGNEPLATLAAYRKIGNSVRFGSYFAPDQEGVIYVGDEVRPKRKNPGFEAGGII